MSLIAHLAIHFISGLIAGFIVWRIWKKPVLSYLFAILGSVFVDLDHLIDYFVAFGWNFKLDYFLWGYQFLESGKIYVLFHGWEYVVILIVLVVILKSKIVKSIILALALGLLFHISEDVLLNNMPIKSYSIIYRVKNNFKIQKLVDRDHYERYLGRKSNEKFSK